MRLHKSWVFRDRINVRHINTYTFLGCVSFLKIYLCFFSYFKENLIIRQVIVPFFLIILFTYVCFTFIVVSIKLFVQLVLLILLSLLKYLNFLRFPVIITNTKSNINKLKSLNVLRQAYILVSQHKIKPHDRLTQPLLHFCDKSVRCGIWTKKDEAPWFKALKKFT